MELVCKYRELYGNTLVIWITDDPYFAREAIRTHSFDFIVRPLEETRFREPLRRIKEGDIAIWHRWPVKAPVYQGICKGNVSERREVPLPPQGQEHFSFGTTRRNGTIWKRIKDYFLSENTL
jgi:response regulator of citrate/malate metabolism